MQPAADSQFQVLLTGSAPWTKGQQLLNSWTEIIISTFEDSKDQQVRLQNCTSASHQRLVSISKVKKSWNVNVKPNKKFPFWLEETLQRNPFSTKLHDRPENKSVGGQNFKSDRSYRTTSFSVVRVTVTSTLWRTNTMWCDRKTWTEIWSSTKISTQFRSHAEPPRSNNLYNQLTANRS